MKYVICAVISFFVLTGSVQAYHQETNQILFSNGTKTITLPSGSKPGGFSLAIADLGLDGTPELIVGNGLGSEPRVRVLRLDGSEIGSFLAYAPTLGVGVNVTTCDLNGDGFDEIITSAQRGGGPHVRIFDRFGIPMGTGEFVYHGAFRGGVNLACGDLQDDERDELVTLPAAGGGPHVRIWNLEQNQLTLTREFFAFAEDEHAGLVGTVAHKQLILSQQKTSTPTYKIFSLDQNNFLLLDERKIFIDANGVASILIHKQELFLSTTSNGLIYNVDAGTQKKISKTHGSFQLASISQYANTPDELVRIEARESFDQTKETKIIVDISEQRLFAYRDGILENSFLISSGKNNATPLGNHQILAKIPYVHYKWSYGPNDPRNYDLGLVPYNLRIYPHIYLHYAYWHNNFGHPMSRGCVNVSLEDMKWLYDWADVGTPVYVIQ